MKKMILNSAVAVALLVGGISVTSCHLFEKNNAPNTPVEDTVTAVEVEVDSVEKGALVPQEEAVVVEQSAAPNQEEVLVEKETTPPTK